MRYLLLFFALFSLLACSRSLDTNASLNMDFSQLNTLSGSYKPEFLIINVHFDGQTHFYEWDCPRGISVCSFPTNVDFNNKTFPSGANRMIQVLLGLENDEGHIRFYYTDRTLDFTGGQMTVNIDGPWHQENSLKQGIVGGRLSEGGNQLNLTGAVKGYYSPPNGKPRMEVIQDNIFADWFSFTFLDTVPLTYIHEASGKVLFASSRLNQIRIKKTNNPDSQAVAIKHPPYHRLSSWEESLPLEFATSISVSDDAWAYNGDVGNKIYELPPAQQTDFLKGILTSGLDMFMNSYTTPGVASDLVFNFQDMYNFSSIDIVTSSKSVSDIVVMLTPSAPISSLQVPYTHPTFVNLTSPTYLSASNSFKLEFPAIGDNENLRIASINLNRKVFDSSYVNGEEHIYGFYDITTQNFVPNQIESNGIRWPVGDFGLNGALFSDPEIDYLGTIENLSLISNTLEWQDEGGPVGNKVSFISGGVPTTNAIQPTDCYHQLTTSKCFEIIPRKLIRGDMLPFTGPYQVSNTVTGGITEVECDPNENFCELSFSYVYGASNMRTMVFHLPEHIDIDYDRAPCAEYAASLPSHRRQDIGNQTEAVPIAKSKLYNNQTIMCPYMEGSNGRRFFNFAISIRD